MYRHIKTTLIILILIYSTTVRAECLKVGENNQGLILSEPVTKSLIKSSLSRDDFFKTLKGISLYETNGCWAGTTGNFDNQYISVGIMQWNFGQGSLQEVLLRYKSKFSSLSHFYSEIDKLMPILGRKIFSECTDRKINQKCKSIILRNDGNNTPPDEAKKEFDNLFNDIVMRQIQVDYFSRAVTSVLSDLDRVYKNSTPKPWQVAWAVDIKTQQGDKFPTDKNIKKIKAELSKIDDNTTKQWIVSSPIAWYSSMCSDRISEGIKKDCDYNLKLWPSLLDAVVLDQARVETLLYSHLIARTAANENGKFQADAFQRRASIAFGKGSVHGSSYVFYD